MDIFGKLERLTKILLQKSGKTITLDAPDVATADHTWRLPDVSVTGTSTIVDTDSIQALSNKTLTTPTIASLANMNHTHADEAGGGLLSDSALASGAAIARTKIAAGTINHVVINSSGSGALSSEAQLAKSRGGFGMDISSLIPSFTGANVFRVDGTIAASQAGIKLYKTVQEAITAAVTAGAAYNNVKLVRVSAGTYTEDITMYDGIVLAAETPTTVKITGKVASDASLSAPTALASIQGVDFIHQPAASGVSFDLIGAISTLLCSFSCYPLANVPVTVVHAAPALGQTAVHGQLTVQYYPLVPFTNSADVFDANGAGTLSIYSSSVLAQSNQSAGNICLINEQGTGGRNYNSVLSYGVITNAAYSGSIRGFCTESASLVSRLAQGCQVRLVGAGAGTAIAFNLDTGATPSEYYYTGCTAFIDGFASEYISYTSVNSVQKIWLNSINKDIPKSGTGRSIITPYDDRKSGFVEWGVVSASNYWSISGSTFTVVPSGVGIVRGAPVAFDAGQSIGLSTGVNYIYMNSLGVIQKSSSGDEALYSDNIVLFQVILTTGGTTKVFKENHPYKFESAVSHAWHRLFGSLLEGTGANTTIYGAVANRQFNIVGSDVLTDHGLDTAISATTTGASFNLVYRTTSGLVEIASSPVTALPSQYNPITSLTNSANNRRNVWRIVAGKDSLEGAYQLFACADTVDYSSLANANNAIANGTVAAIPSELNLCEVVMLGYVVLKADGSGTGTTEAVTIAKKTFGASFLGGSPSNTANLVSITDILGPIINTASTVQSALEEVNTNAMAVSPSGTANALVRFTGTGGQVTGRTTVTCDGAGNFAAVLTINSHAIPSGSGAIVTVDSADTLTNKTLTTPTIASFVNANHDHSASGANGGLIIAASATQQGAVSVAAQTFAGEKTFASGVKVDTISNATSASGVNVENVLIKAGVITGVISTNGVAASVALSGSLATGVNAIYTPASGVTAFEIFMRSTNASGSGAIKVYVVQNTAWEYSANETGMEIGTLAVATGTGAVTLTAAATGTVKGIVNIVM
jgi:hypothetical protein